MSSRLSAACFVSAGSWFCAVFFAALFFLSCFFFRLLVACHACIPGMRFLRCVGSIFFQTRRVCSLAASFADQPQIAQVSSHGAALHLARSGGPHFSQGACALSFWLLFFFCFLCFCFFFVCGNLFRFRDSKRPDQVCNRWRRLCGSLHSRCPKSDRKMDHFKQSCSCVVLICTRPRIVSYSLLDVFYRTLLLVSCISFLICAILSDGSREIGLLVEPAPKRFRTSPRKSCGDAWRPLSLVGWRDARCAIHVLVAGEMF